MYKLGEVLIDVKSVFFGESLFAFLMKPMLPLFWFSRAERVIVKKEHAALPGKGLAVP